MSTNYLLEVVTADATPTTIRMSGSWADSTGVYLNGVEWKPCITALPEMSFTFVSDGEFGDVQASYGSISWVHNLANWSNLTFNNAQARLWMGNMGDPFASYRQVWGGNIGSLEVSGLEATATLIGNESDLETNLLYRSYAGTGGAEGNDDLTGTLKPWCSGVCLNITPILVDPAYQIYQYHAYGATTEVHAVYDNAFSIAADPVSTVPTTYADLQNLALSPGQWAKAPAIGCFRIGGAPSGVVTADVQGAMDGASYPATVNTIVQHMLKVAQVSTSLFHTASLSTFTESWCLYQTDQITIGDAIRDALNQAGGYLITSSTGLFGAGKYFEPPTNTIVLNRDRSTVPLVRDNNQKATTSPAYSVKIGTERNWTVLSSDQVSDAVKQAAATALWAGITGTGKPADYADVTSQNTSKDTSAVAGVPSTTIVANLNTIAANPNLDTTAPAAPTGLTIASALAADGSVDVTFSWTANTESDFDHYELQAANNGGGYVTIASPTTTSFVLHGLIPNQSISAKIRAFDRAGNASGFSSVVTATTTKDTTPPAVPTALSASSSFGSIYLAWTNANDTDLSNVQVWEGATSASANATLIATVNAEPSKAGGYTRSGLATGATKFYFLKSVDTSGNASAFSSSVSATTASVANADMTPGLQVPATVATLPSATGYSGPSLIYNQADGKLYRYSAGAFVASVATADLTGTITSAQIAAAAVDLTKFASGLTAVQVVSALPSTATEGQVASYNGKLYRYTSGAWTSAVAATDVSGALTAAQIASGAIDLTKLASGLTAVQIVTTLPSSATEGQIASYQGKLYRYTSGAWTTAVAAADLTGTVTAAQIASGAIDTTKLASGLIAPATVATLPSATGYSGPSLIYNQADGKLYRYVGGAFVASVPTTDLSGTVASAQIADSAITASKISNAVIDATKFASTVKPVEIVSALPSSGNVAGRTVFLTSDGKLYRYVGSAWTAAVATTDLSGTIAAAQIASGAVDLTKLASGLTAVQVVSTLPTSATEGQIASYQGKLYRYTSGAWTAAIPTTDLTGTIAGTQIAPNAITGTQIADGSISTPELAANAVTAAKIAANTITASQIAASAITTNEIAANTITASNIAADTITSAQIAAGAITTSELAAGSVTAAKIVAGTITSNEIAANTITAGDIAANTITSAQIATDTITAGNIAAGAITTSELATNSVTASKLVVGDVTNYIQDPTLSDPNYWMLQNGTFNTSDSAPLTAMAARSAFKSVATGVKAQPDSIASMAGGQAFPVEGGAAYRLNFTYYATSGFNGQIYLTVFWYKADGTTVSSEIFSNGADFRSAPAGAATTGSIDTMATAPADALFGTVLLRITWSSTVASAGTGYIAFPIVQRANAGELTVDGTITASKIKAGTITGDRIAGTTITGTNIAGQTITAANIAADTITAGQIAAGAITASELGANSVTATNIVAGSITGDRLTANTITASQIAADTITAAQIGAGAITTNELAAGAVTATKIVAGTITSNEIASQTITAGNIATDTITAAQIAAGAITASEVAAGAITTSKLAVVSDNIFGDSVMSDQSWWTTNASGYGAGSISASSWYWQQGGDNPSYSGTANAWRVTSTSGVPITYTGTGTIAIQSPLQLGVSGGVVYSIGLNCWNTSNQPASFTIEWRKADRSLISGASILTIPAGQGNTGYQSAQVTAPAGAAMYDLVLQVTGNGSTAFSGWVITGNWQVRKANDATLYVAGTIAGNSIVGQSITAAQIAAQTITASNIATDTITANQIAAGAITASEIAAGAITASKLGIVGASLFVDGQMQDASWWTSNNGGNSVTGAGYQNPSNSYYIDTNASLSVVNAKGSLNAWVTQASVINGSTANNIQIVPPSIGGIIPGEYYEFKATLFNSSNRPNLSMSVQWYNSTTYITSVGAICANDGVSRQVSFQAQAPVGATHFRLYWDGNGSTAAFTGQLYVGGITVRQAATGTLIVDGSITTTKLSAQAVTADKIAAGTITGDRISTSASLPGTVTVGTTGVSIATVQAQASNPATQINASTTQISPGLINISGSTTLANWRNGSDSTKIEGGSIAANTVTANKLVIGNRNINVVNLDFSVNAAGNTLSWTTGAILYINDAGASTGVFTAAGSVAGSSGNTYYVYWTQGAGSLVATTDSSVASAGDKVLLASWGYGTKLIVANYGGTIIDGSRITTGTITASQIAANAITISSAGVLGGAGSGQVTLGGMGYSGDLNATRGAPSGTLVGGTAATTIESYANDPANRINNNTTTISGGKITTGSITASQIATGAITISASGSLGGAGSGQVTLSGIGYSGDTNATRGAPSGTLVGSTAATTIESYANDPANRINNNTTTISGGKISANTVTADKMVIGARGVVPIGIFFGTDRSNTCTWTGGYVEWFDEGFNRQVTQIAAGSVARTNNVTGVMWVWFDRVNSVANGILYSGETSLASVQSNSNNIVLAQYWGGTNLIPVIGGTIVDGDHISTNSINANKIVAGTITADRIVDNSLTQKVILSSGSTYTGTGTPTQGGGTAGGGGGSGNTSCVHIASFLPNGGLAGEAKEGDELLLLNREDDDGYHVEPLQRIRFGRERCLRVETESGITLVASISTPITSRNGVILDIRDSLGAYVPVLDRGAFRWERITGLMEAGVQDVALISAGDGVYAAGEHDDGRFIFTHNAAVKP